ncbi:MAG: hypothetical protein WAM60_15345 [Candidatus Promineifilaceae bacterium]
MANWLRILLAVLVGAHGIGHILFLVPLLSSADWGQSTRSWLLGSGLLARGLGSLIWIVAIAGFVGVAIGLFRGSDWWRPIAITASVISALGLALFWARPITSPVGSALIFNLLVLGSLLVFRWPPATQP